MLKQDENLEDFPEWLTPLFETQCRRLEIEETEKWLFWKDRIPYINFPALWKVRAVPPFGGAIIRYNIINSCGEWVSVYLDVYNRLGYMKGPYWEIYPGSGKEGDPERFYIDDIDNLVIAIEGVGKQ